MYLNSLKKLKEHITKNFNKSNRIVTLLIGQSTNEDPSEFSDLKNFYNTISQNVYSFQSLLISFDQNLAFWDKLALFMNGKQRDPITKLNYS